jgi:nucleotide-binding universal stress UspA family protein
MLNICTILHPTDFSTQSEAALSVAGSLAGAVKAGLLVLHVYPNPVSHGEVTARRQPNGFHELLWQDLEKIKPSDPNVRVDHRLEEGDAGIQILRVAQEVPCGLIVMGTHGRTGLGRLLMGSVAEKVLRSAPCAVVTAKTPDSSGSPMKFQTILFPTDFSESSQYALDLAFALARDLKARLLVLHVAAPPPFVTYGEFEKVMQQSSGYRRELEEKLRQCEKPDCNAEFHLKEGEPAAEILHFAEEVHGDMIVMGTHGRTGLGRLLLGSVAENVLRKAACPVLTVKLPSGAQPVPATDETVSGFAPLT